MSRVLFFINHCLFLAVVLTWQPSVAAEADYFNVIEKLHVNLLRSYNNQIRPVINHTDALNVELSMRLTSFNFDELQSRFSAIGFFLMSWKDPRFMWSPAEYEGLTTIHLPNEKIWKPDFEVYNSYGLLSKERSFAPNDVLISNDGTVIWVPISNMVSICPPDATYYPFDSVTCTTKIGSWTHNALKINISPTNNSTTVDISELINKRMSEWNIKSTQVSVEVKKYDCCTEPYQSLVMKFTIQRSLSTTITIPTIVIMVLILATFIIPPAMDAKLIVGVFNLTLLCGYLLYFKTVLPAGNENTPLIVSFYNGSLVVVISSILSTILSLRWTRLSKSVSPPTFIRSCLSGRIGTILGVSHKYTSNNLLVAKELTEKVSQQFVHDDGESQEIEIKQAWTNISVALERIMLFIYFSFIAFHVISFLG
ncbi:acetylcholine receptor subunit alpha-type acr-16-like [Daphnia pulicaria]|uniref:acetylcholine receptor subunit alpha-type acr-16-like n=1 Tax=Daphnia pulicaria TaxID=35523 RepID=UPI001EEB82BE|nr:acetylcholine receptor subunit alpha-type acr-16-like [Daphnia pulicaria]